MKKNSECIVKILIIIFCALVVTIVVVGFKLKDYSLMINNIILCTTGFFVAWYTIEAYYTRKYYDHQAEYEIRPYLKIEMSPVDRSIFQEIIIVKNEGRGMAKNIEFVDLRIKENFQDTMKEKFSVRKISILSSKDSAIISFEDINGKLIDVAKYINQINSSPSEKIRYHIEQEIKENIFLTIKYEDISDNKYIAIFEYNKDYKEKFILKEQKKLE
ncbi:MAG TPA: hypothetical protein VMD74_05390 [Candidatus Methylomirabilis sp.]|nr:hypothetical protein [Candidatus Methylomirabilis sp.]